MPLKDPAQRKAYNQTYRSFHAEELKATNRAYHATNKVSIRARKKTYMPDYTASTAARRRESCLLRNYGISSAVYDQLFAQQNGGCAICGTTSPGGRSNAFFAVDHDHATNEVRGLLCAHCNTGLGKFRDDAELLRKAAQYLVVNRTG